MNFLKHINILIAHYIQNNSDYYSGKYEIDFRYWTDSFFSSSSLKSSVNYLNTKMFRKLLINSPRKIVNSNVITSRLKYIYFKIIVNKMDVVCVTLILNTYTLYTYKNENVREL